jgi:hypothetical protein
MGGKHIIINEPIPLHIVWVAPALCPEAHHQPDRSPAGGTGEG